MTRIHVLTVCCALALVACGPSYCEPAPGTICTVAGSGEAGYAGDGEDARAAELYQPMDVEVGPDDRIYIVDWNNHMIRAVNVDGTIERVVGTGQLGDGPAGPALEADFNHPTNVTFDASGRLYIAAWHNSRIRRVDFSTGLMEELCGTGMRAYAGDGGPASTAILDLPAGLAFHGDDLIVVDQANQVIRRIGADGMINRVAGQCIVVDGCASGGTPTQCAGSDKFSCDPLLCMRPCAPSYAGDDGPALDARFAYPFGQSADPAGRVVVDADGNIILADTRNHRIRRVSTDGMVTTIAGDGTAGYGGDEGPATAAQLNNPVDVDLGPNGELYIADTFNDCIRRMDTDGTIHTAAGVCGERGFEGDSAAPERALLDRPYGLDVDLANNRLYIADTMNNRIRVVDL